MKKYSKCGMTPGVNTLKYCSNAVEIYSSREIEISY